MFCPGCGQQPASERIRYCTHCGFALNKLTEFLTNEAPTAVRQFDITLGAGLMLIGTIKSVLLALAIGTPRQEALTIGVFALGLFLGMLQLFFQLSPRQKGLSLGATLMFLATLAGLAATWLFGIFGALAIVAAGIPIIFSWSRLVRAFFKLFFDKKAPVGEHQPLPVQPGAALEAANSAQQVEVETQRIQPMNVAQPRSVTENTTGLLDQ